MCLVSWIIFSFEDWSPVGDYVQFFARVFGVDGVRYYLLGFSSKPSPLEI